MIEAIPTFLSEIYLAFFTDVNNQYKEDLQNHIEKYEHSIKSGHKVLAIGHSQGNLFINQEYKLLDDWMKMYFSAVAIATPANNVIGDESSTAPYVTFYNDMITELVKESFEGNTEGNLSASWTELDNHELKTYLNPSFKGLKAIKDLILYKLVELNNVESQWNVKEKEAKTCEETKTLFIHKYVDDYTIENAYPFSADEGKVYIVGMDVVKALYGGYEIIDLEGENDICYKLNATGEKIYLEEKEELFDGVYIKILESDMEYEYSKDTGEFRFGVIGDNYWEGNCQEYDRRMILEITNMEKLSEFTMTRVGFDDWISIKVNGVEVYKSKNREDLPSDCELSKNFNRSINIDIKTYLQEGENNITTKTIVTGGGETWFTAIVK